MKLVQLQFSTNQLQISTSVDHITSILQKCVNLNIKEENNGQFFSLFDKFQDVIVKKKSLKYDDKETNKKNDLLNGRNGRKWKCVRK